MGQIGITKDDRIRNARIRNSVRIIVDGLAGNKWNWTVAKLIDGR